MRGGVMREGILRGMMIMSIMSILILKCSYSIVSAEEKEKEEEMGMEEEQVDVDRSAKDIKKDIKIGGGDNS